jgi:hypothetical protein
MSGGFQKLLILMGLLAIAACQPDEPVTQSQFVFLSEDETTLASSELADYRAVYARVIDRLAMHQANAVALKFFFFDSETSDVDLANSMNQLPVLLQFALRGEAGSTMPVEQRQKWSGDGTISNSEKLPVSNNIQLPRPALVTAANRLGFVDVVEPFSPQNIPMIGLHDGEIVKSLILQLLEIEYGEARLNGDKLELAGREFRVDRKGRIRCDIDRHAIIHQETITGLLSGDASAETFANRTVVVGYVGADSPMFETGFFETIPAHELFFTRLICLEQQILTPR